MIEILQGVALAWVIVKLYFLSGQQYKLGWAVGLSACIVWGVVAVLSGLYGLLLQQVIVSGFVLRALWRLKATEDNA